MKKAFTLIELMIVVAIIAIIAAIAIPNLMESKKAANESSASASLKTYATNQATYQANNYSMLAANGGDGTAGTSKMFASTWQLLGGDAANGVAVNSAGTVVALIAPVFAKADVIATAWNGYFFADMNLPAVGGTLKYNHGLSALPAQYGTTGVNTFIVNEQAIVYMKDTAGNAAVAGDFPTLIGDGTWVTP